MPVIAGKGLAVTSVVDIVRTGLHVMNTMHDAPFRQHLNARCDERRDLTARVIEHWCEGANTAA
ncbi:hypothetical protein F3J14_16505 [Burkholderia sp. Tr-862]|uniref:hypothetical protein n=1 Tax=Burkholderia sp. Tr-862 TaxID=2608331 RepID=UPI00141A0B6B|nr:hypothetical protein [Burkholderia sp. Tr-862]NIF42457.1 hypothetical protein [Burkholderia sp. Tr-862]